MTVLKKEKAPIAAIVTCDGLISMQLHPHWRKFGYEPFYLPKDEIPTKCELYKFDNIVTRLVKLKPILVIFYPTNYFGINNGQAANLSQRLDLKARIVCFFHSKDGPTGNMTAHAGSWNIRYVKLGPNNCIPRKDFVHAIMDK